MVTMAAWWTTLLGRKRSFCSRWGYSYRVILAGARQTLIK